MCIAASPPPLAPDRQAAEPILLLLACSQSSRVFATRASWPAVEVALRPLLVHAAAARLPAEPLVPRDGARSLMSRWVISCHVSERMSAGRPSTTSSADTSLSAMPICFSWCKKIVICAPRNPRVGGTRSTEARQVRGRACVTVQETACVCVCACVRVCVCACVRVCVQCMGLHSQSS